MWFTEEPEVWFTWWFGRAPSRRREVCLGRAARSERLLALRSQPWVCASRVLLARAGIVMVVKSSHLRVVRARVRRSARSTARPRMQPCSTCSGGGRRGRTRRRRRRGSPRASLKQRVVDRRRSRERERERRAARWSSATGSSRARPSRVPDAHASAMIPRRLGAAAASAAPPTGALRSVLIDQSAPPTTRVEEDQCSAAPSLSSRPSLRT